MLGQQLWLLLLLTLGLHHALVLGLSSYFYSRYKATWHQAKTDCEDVGGFLVKFDNMEELSQVISNRANWLTNTLNTNVGLSDLDAEGYWRWLDGTVVSPASMWRPGEPAGGTAQNCGLLVDTRLHDSGCNVNDYFICEVDEESEEAQLKQDIRSCWVVDDLLRNVNGTDSGKPCLLPTSTYYYSRYKTTWHQAKADCEHVGGYLVKFNHLTELIKLIRNNKQWLTDDRNMNVGLSDLDTEGDWRWLDGTVVSSPGVWRPGEPAGGTVQNCAVLITDRLHDGSCNAANYFICEVASASEEAHLKQDIRSCWVANDLLRNVKGTDSEDDVKCPRDKLYFSPSHWKNSKTWDEGKAFCKKANASLAKITSLEEQLMVDRFRLVKKFGYTWFGGTDVVVEGQFTWDDDAPFVWPTFLNSAAPAADNTKNCVATGGTKTWSVATCTTKYPILCEIDVAQAPNDQTCHWLTSSSQTWDNNLLACQAAGGTLANIRNIRQFERIKNVIGSNTGFYTGLADIDTNWDFVCTDGSVMTWSNWKAEQPNHASGAQAYIAIYTAAQVFGDAYSSTYIGLCEKKVFRFRDAEVLHADGSISVECHDGYQFRDGSLTKTWTCGEINVNHEDSCAVLMWKTVGPDLSHLNMSVLVDGDEETCLSGGTTQHVMTLSYNKTFSSDFGLEVILSPDTEHLRFDVIRAFTTTDLSSPSATCQLSGPLSKCRHVSGSTYTCKCTGQCYVYVKMFQPNNIWRSLNICELRIK